MQFILQVSLGFPVFKFLGVVGVKIYRARIIYFIVVFAIVLFYFGMLLGKRAAERDNAVLSGGERALLVP